MDVKLSIVMSVYNGGENLAPTIESVINQTFSDFEFIIINDKSTDNTLEILNNYKMLDNRIILINNVENLGLSKSLVKGISKSRGKYIARIDSGDFMIETRLEKQYEVFKNDIKNEIGLVSTNCIVKHIIYGSETISYMNVPKNSDEIRNRMGFKNIIPHVSVMFRKSCYETVGGYDSNLSTSQDYDLWIKLLSISNVYSLQEYLTVIIFDDGIPSITLNKNKEQKRNGIKIVKRALAKKMLPLYPAILGILKNYIMLYTPLVFINYLRKNKRKVFKTY